MGNRLSKIYTRTGDNGSTALADGQRVQKNTEVFMTMGDVDELNAQIGVAYAQVMTLKTQQTQNPATAKTADTSTTNSHLDSKQLDDLLNELSIIQHLLFNLGGELAMPVYQGIDESHVQWLETQIDRMNATLSPLKDFILPRGSLLVSQLHVARAVCRRAERQAVSLKLAQSDAIRPTALAFINRLSDWLFVASRYCTHPEQHSEVLWQKQVLEQLR